MFLSCKGVHAAGTSAGVHTWKTRWVVLRKPSPVADCLSLLVYKERKKGKEKSSSHKERLNVTLEGICGVEPGPGYDGVSYTLSILCLTHMLVLGFNSREALLAWDARVRYSLGEGAGVFFLSCSEGEQISFLFDCIVRGINPSRAPHGLRPSLPDPSTDPASAEERISQEASELEKRLSMLSHCSLASSTASTYSCSTSVAGDDRSSISSSSSSQSDTSYGSRLPFRMEPLARPNFSNETASSSSTLKAQTSSDDRLYAAVMGGPGTRPSSAQPHLRCLHDSGRQSSLDSGIGIAAGSQSSYSGSCSSCTGSLDTASQGGGEEFGSVASLPAPPSSPPSAPPPSSPPPPSPFQSTPTPEYTSAASSGSCASRSSSCASHGHSEEYQMPSLLRLWYDTPRSIFQTMSLRKTSSQGAPSELGQVNRSSVDEGSSQGLSSSPTRPRAQRQAMMQRAHSWGSERATSVESEGRSTPRPLMAPEGLAYSPLSVREEHEDCVDGGNKLAGLKQSSPSRPPSAPPPPPTTLSMYRPGDSTINYVNIPISPLPAKTNKELLYTELDLQEPGSALASSPHSAVREEGSVRYAHLNITAMETAHRVGAEHVQGREDRLNQLENRRRGPPT
ncbi:hypothetical protein INR49_015952 [Caranx melampygus]|nr:hypothetical protein INR49_015952 [Caranx melampygus]